ncbi:hypothetical protein BC938DRAFT_476390 [Jimgerdemannia flammicorona]|uniref:Uncharacterized protein n=1 Tax=Jimgerdemannia flammicorona TaxID=994334 RepID=A0A433QQK0_9FUNG|nr:hypothetical protein BC938DRAFT_476390 [Jimgerdemannia flammicorona]
MNSGTLSGTSVSPKADETEIHIGSEDVRIATVLSFTQEVLLERANAIDVVLEGDVAVGREGTGKYGNVPEDGLEGLVKNVGHLILKVLGRDERVQKIDTGGTSQGTDFTASTGDIGVDVEGLPQVIDGGVTGPRTDIEQDTDVGLDDGTKGLEEPTMGVDFLGILLLQTEHDLDGDDVFVRTLEFELGVDGELRRVLVMTNKI